MNQNNSSIEEQVQRISLDDDDDDTSTPSSMNVSDVAAKYALLSPPASSHLQQPTSFGQQKDRLMETNGADTKRLQPPQLTDNSTTSGNVSSTVNGEPIYAVVDLKNKYARRAKLQALEEQMEKERPKSFHCSASDYEEVQYFCLV